MNRTYRIVWNAARNAFIVTHENAKTKGKPSSTRKGVVSAVAAALLAMAATPAMAATDCLTPGVIIIDGPATAGCGLAGGDSLTVTSAGSIIPTTGVDAVTVSAVTVGAINNSGTISQLNGNTGINVTSGGRVGSIVNSGTISGQWAGIWVGSGSAITSGIDNQAGGVISASSSGGISVLSASVSGGITNAGTISNSGSSYGAIHFDFTSALTGNITNSGTITGTGFKASGIAFKSSSSMTGSIINEAAGTISGIGKGAHGITFSSSSITGNIENAGTISADAIADPLGSTSAVGIALSSSSLDGSIINTGTISAFASSSGNGIDIGNTTITGSITNSAVGSIKGDSNGINLNNSGTVSGAIANSGVISGGQKGVYLRGGSTVGSLTNNAGGTISGGSSGILLSSGSTIGSLSNAGTISGGSNSGVAIYLRGSTITGSLTNSGTISASGTTGGGSGIFLSGSTITGSLVNSGTISGGSNNAIFVDVFSTVSSIDIDGNNTASFVGTVLATATPMTILSGATYTLQAADDFQVASFTNNGTAQFAAGPTNFTLANVIGNTFTNNGVLAVAAGGTGTLTGNYTQAANATLRIGASDDTTYGKLIVSGTATLPTNARINVDVTNPNFAFTATSMTGVLTAGTLTSDGTFAVTDNSALFNFTASKNGNAVDLALEAVPVSNGGTGNAANAFTVVNSPAGARAARVIDSLVADYTANGTSGNAGMDAVLTQLGTFTTDAELVAAVTQTVPLVGAAMKRASTAARASLAGALAGRIRAANGQSSGDEFVTDGNAWFKPLGAWAKQDDNNGTSGYKANTYGLVTGADGELASGARIGAALGITRTTVDSNAGLQSGKVTGYQAALYGSMDVASDYLVDWQADVGYNQNTGSRRITFMNTSASSDYSGTAVHVGTGIARDLTLASGNVLTPSLRAEYSHLRDKAYTETGAGALNLKVDGQTFHELLVVADAAWTHTLESGASLTANLGVAHDVHAKQDDLTSAYSGGGAAFGTSGIKPSATTARGGLGYNLNTAGGMKVNLHYNVEARSGYTAQGVSAKMDLPF